MVLLKSFSENLQTRLVLFDHPVLLFLFIEFGGLLNNFPIHNAVLLLIVISMKFRVVMLLHMQVYAPRTGELANNLVALRLDEKLELIVRIILKLI